MFPMPPPIEHCLFVVLEKDNRYTSIYFSFSFFFFFFFFFA